MKRGLYELERGELVRLKYTIEYYWLRVELLSVGHYLLTRLLESISRALRDH